MSDTNWTRSSFAEGLSLEVSRDGSDTVLVRDGKEEAWNALVLSWSVDEWRELLAALKQGEDHKDILLAPEGAWFGRLWFVGDEWNAFVKGVKAGEFDVEKLSSGGEVGPASGVVAGSNQIAATGAGNGPGGVVPVPVAAQPPELGDELVELVAEALHEYDCWDLPEDLRRPFVDAHEIVQKAYRGLARAGLEVAIPLLRQQWESEPGLRWGSGPLVDHNLETPAIEHEGAQQ